MRENDNYNFGLLVGMLAKYFYTGYLMCYQLTKLSRVSSSQILIKLSLPPKYNSGPIIDDV